MSQWEFYGDAMNDENPFANWPHLDKPEREPQRALLPAAPDMEDHDMASKNGLENFLGGTPTAVFVKLLFISLVVGALLMWLEIRPMDILRGVQHFIDRIYDLGFGAVRLVIEYVLAGAVIVVPIWFVLRLMNMGGRR